MGSPNLLVYEAPADSKPAVELACVATDIPQSGFREGAVYQLASDAAFAHAIFLDDEALPQDAITRHFIWKPQFYAGTVEVTLEDLQGHRFTYLLDVAPAPNKLGRQVFEQMLHEVYAFDATLLLGPSAAAQPFGRDPLRMLESPLVALARLRRFGPSFLAAVKALCSRPHRRTELVQAVRAFSAIQRIYPPTLCNDKILALLATEQQGVSTVESIYLETRVPAQTGDTPANRAVKALLLRFRAAVRNVKAAADACALGGEPEEQLKRKPRRIKLLQEMESSADMLLSSALFQSISRADVSAAGLTQLSALPAYSRAYRLGCQALRTGVVGEVKDDALSISPTYDVYEKWCFVRLHNALRAQFSLDSWTYSAHPAATCELAYAAKLDDQAQLQLLFQPTFPADSVSLGSPCVSISGERRPDILLLLKTANRTRTLILDAKYRSGRGNVLDAMTSAHIYHDSLRINGRAPDLCLLLLPGPPDVPSLHAEPFWLRHCVGAVGNVYPGSPDLGLAGLVNRTPKCGHHELREALSTDGRFGRLRRTGNRPAVVNAVLATATMPQLAFRLRRASAARIALAAHTQAPSACAPCCSSQCTR